MADTASLSSKYQLSVPKALREQQGWEAGQRFVFIPKRHGVLLMPVPTWDEMEGVASATDSRDYRDREDRDERRR